MEQQPGPVNWVYNPSPLPGMIRLWSWEALLMVLKRFVTRWRCPFAQEQMHAGLLRPDNSNAPALAEAKKVAGEIADAQSVEECVSEVAAI